MKRILGVIATLLLCVTLAGCATTGADTLITQDVPMVVSPPDTLFSCPQLSQYPNPETLTNDQLATIITTLVKYNKVCGANMYEIQTYIDNAKAQIAASTNKN
jgi:hypothetical protein